MRPYGNRTVERLFQQEEFLELFVRAARRCVSNARKFYCEGPIPESLAFYCRTIDPRLDERPEENLLRVPAATLRDSARTLPLLWRDDGFHRPEVRLHPVGVTDKHTVLAVEIPQGPAAWSNELLAGEFAVPEEPFVLRGPSKLADDENGAELPRVKLPRIALVPRNFGWRVTAEECHPLSEVDPGVRLAAAERLARRLAHGFEPGELEGRAATAAAAEENALVRRGFADLLDQRALPAWQEVRRGWLHDRDAHLRASAYGAVAALASAEAFELLLGLLAGERAEKGQLGLVRALATCVGTSGERYTRLNAATRPAPLTRSARRELAKISAHFIA